MRPVPAGLWLQPIIASAKSKTAVVVRLADRIVCFPTVELKRWEHVVGNPEMLLITAGCDGVRFRCEENPRIVSCNITYNGRAGVNLTDAHDIIASAPE